MKISITLIAFAFILWKLLTFDNLSEALQLIKEKITHPNWLYLTVIFLGLPLNWFFEIFKWRHLLLKIHPISFASASTAVLTGLAMALFTPNRIGEIFTRVWILPVEKRSAGVALSGINSLALFLTVQIAGIIGLGILVGQGYLINEFPVLKQGWFYSLIGLVAIGLVVLYFNPKWIGRLFLWLQLEKKFPGINQIFSSLTWSDKTTLLLLSALKYLTFSFQFYCLLLFLGAEIPLIIGLAAIMSIYLLLNYIPVITLGEAGVRGSINLLILGLFTDAELAILAASFAIWILNIAFPSLIGIILMKKVKLKSDF